MMKLLNPIYIIAVLIGLGLWHFIGHYTQESVLFFGFTENKETEINLNHPVEVNQILVTAGQKVCKGDTLLEVSQVKFEYDIQQTLNRIAELKAKEEMWLLLKQGEVDRLAAQKRLKIEDLQSKIMQLKTKQNYNASLFEDLKNVQTVSTTYDPLAQQIAAFQKEKILLETTLDSEIEMRQQELAIGNNPFRQQIHSLNAEINLNKQKIDKLSILAPADGLIGTIGCKEAEHILAFKTLMTFYEPRPTQVKGYVHENLIVHVNLQDSLLIKASKDGQLQCKGVVTGLGSRIVEIPERLRKMPEIKTYGREILIQIPAQNNFLQKEKVTLRLPEDKTPIKMVYTNSREKDNILAKQIQQ